MGNSRTSNTIRNSVVGIGAFGLKALLAFVTRTVFIKILGVDYLGINGLFANILTMLALSDLGLYTVMTYSLYKPVAQNDTELVASLVRYFQKLYNFIALAVLAVGLALVPLLPKLVHGITLPQNELTLYYLILLLNSVLSYFAISRATLFRADQKVYVVKVIETASTILMYITQIVLLMLFRSFMIFLICQTVYTLLNNITLTIWAGKKYPYLKKLTTTHLAKEINQEIWKNLKASFLYKIGAYIMNSTDNILISLIISTTVVGYFSNYVTIYSLINQLIMILISAVLASIGHFLVTESNAKKYQLFKILMLTMYTIATIAASCYLAGMNDFIRIWIGSEFIIGGGFIYALAFNRFIFCAIHPLWMVRESSGIFVSMRYVMLAAAALNIGLSVWLGNRMGVTGIILATSLSYLLTVYWYEPFQLAQKVFHNKMGSYWIYVIKLLLASLPGLAAGVWFGQIETGHILFLLLKFSVCGLVSLSSFVLCFRHTPEYAALYEKIEPLMRRIPFVKQKIRSHV